MSDHLPQHEDTTGGGIPRPPAHLPTSRAPAPPSETSDASGIAMRNSDPGADRGSDTARSDASGDQPRTEDLGPRDFAGAGEMAADQRRQGRERGAGLGAGSSANRDARYPAQSEGEVPEDDMD